MSTYTCIYFTTLRDNGEGEREVTQKLPEKRMPWEIPSISFFSNPCIRKEQNIPFEKILIKTGLVIHTDLSNELMLYCLRLLLRWNFMFALMLLVGGDPYCDGL